MAKSPNFIRLSFVAGVMVASLGLLIAAAAFYDSAFSRGSGEWAGLGQLFTVIVEVPSGLMLIGLAFTQQKRVRRVGFIVIGILFLLVPIANDDLAKWKSHRRQQELQNLHFNKPKDL